MKLGLLAYATNTGLGVQTYNVWKHLKPHKTMLVDLSKLNGLPLDNRYDGGYFLKTDGIPTDEECDRFLDGLDIVFLAETPLNYNLFAKAKQRGIITVLQYNFEFLDYFMNRALPQPTVFAAPSLWNIEQLTPDRFGAVTPLTVPVDEDPLTRRKITEAKHFFHIAGRPAIHDRNGTFDFIEAAKMASDIEPDLRFTVYCQAPTVPMLNAVRNTKVQMVREVPNYGDLYVDGDVLVMPRKYGGLCLPVNEAVYCGIPVLMTDIDPNNRWLPAEWLVPIRPIVQRFFTRTSISVYHIDTVKLAQKMLDLSRHPEAVQSMAAEARSIGEFMGWSKQRERYQTYLEGLCRTSALLSR